LEPVTGLERDLGTSSGTGRGLGTSSGAQKRPGNQFWDFKRPGSTFLTHFQFLSVTLPVMAWPCVTNQNLTCNPEFFL